MDELTWWSTRRLAAAIAAGEVSAEEALASHLRRIEEVNPQLNAVVTLEPERAWEQARRADALLVSSRTGEGSIPALHGVPMTHKDTHDVAGMRTTLGSPVYADRVPHEDALVVARLRAAGVISTGKSNVPELAAGSHTVNPVFGATLNPYDRSRSVAGSSGGVGAVLAAGIQASGDGSDMGGSLRTPASFNNVVGLRPSQGRIPHLVPGRGWAWLAQPGFMARTVGDVALLMGIASGPHPDGPCSAPQPGTVFDLPQFALDADHQPDLAGVRIGVSADLGGLVEIEPEVRRAVLAAVPLFEGLNATVEDDCPDLRDADEVFHVQRAYDFVASWGEVVAAEDAREGGSRIKESIRWNTRVGRDLTVEALVSADAARARLWQATRRFFEQYDVLLCATAQVVPFDVGLEWPVEVNGVPMATYLDWMRAATLISATGCPAISVPGGFTRDGLPIGIQLVAAPGRDVHLLQVAHAFESVTRHTDWHPAL